MARTKVARSAQTSHQSDRKDTTDRGASPGVRYITISPNDFARDPFRYVSKPPRMGGEPVDTRDDDDSDE